MSKKEPLVTFALFAYNQEKYIREAVEGAFSQTYEPLEIILSDDCSIDSTFEIMEKMVESYGGPHTIRLFKNTNNLGLATHFSEVIEKAKGKYIIIAAGDDISLPTRTDTSVEVFKLYKDITFVESSRIDFSNDETNVDNLIKRNSCSHKTLNNIKINVVSIQDFLSRKVSFSGASRAIKKSTVKRYGKLQKSCPTEDTPTLLRLLMSGRGCQHNRIEVLRRVHEKNLSSRESLNKMNLDNILNQYLVDIKRAETNKIIDEKTSNDLTIWAKKVIKKRKFYQKCHNNLFIKTLFKVKRFFTPK